MTRKYREQKVLRQDSLSNQVGEYRPRLRNNPSGVRVISSSHLVRSPPKLSAMPRTTYLLHSIIAIGITLAPVPLLAAEVDLAGYEFFEKKIRPVLVEQCFECHSKGAKKIGGGLLLDTKAGLAAGGESGPAVVAGNPKGSLLVQALKYDGLEMPPKKPLPESVVADFTKWIAMGAADPREAAAGETTAGLSLEDGRQFWSFRPITNPSPPAVKDARWPRSDIDRFIAAKLEAAKLQPAPDADPATLLRRVYFDLIGLPPSAEEVDAFVAAGVKNPAARQQAFTAVVDRLLASPQFGERWARHWLDIARYGESNGNVRNATFPHAWRYRDYVIQSFNEDKPYDRFVTEQIAGDLLSHGSEEARAEHLTATGFLAIGSKPNASGNPNFTMDVIGDQIEVVTTSIMGLTVACARCHDHKYDPVPTRDYYALAGVFESTETLYGAQANTMGGAPPTELLVLDSKARPVAVPTDEKALEKTKGKRQKSSQAKLKRRMNGVATYAAETPLAMGVRDRVEAVDSRINIKGETKRLGASVPRGFIQVCSLSEPPTIEPKESGRLQLAQWLTDPAHPLTARVMANRVWHHLFGQGIVSTPDNFGLHGERPTHPELLDYLATQFRTDGWSIKQLIRSIVLSRTYQMSGRYDERAFQIDPDDKLVWRHQRRRLDAESFRDAVLQTSGLLDPSPGERSLVASIGEALIQDKLTPDKIQKPSNRRSVYLCILRSGEPEELTVFDLADPSLIVGARNVTTVPAQSLFLMNSPFVVQAAQRFSERVAKESSGDVDARVGKSYRLALGREPTSNELQRAREFIKRETATASSATVSSADATAKAGQTTDVWSVFCQALLSSSEFRYVD